MESVSNRTEEALRESSQRLQLALSAARLGDWSWDAATDLVTLGPEAANIFGVSRDVPTTWAALRETLHPEDRERVRAAVEEALRSRKDYDIEYRVSRNGAFIWAASQGRGVYASDGRVLAMIGIIREITDRKLAEETRSHLASVVESSDDAIISLRMDTTILTWNRGAERMFGYTAQEAIGQSITILIPAERGDEERRILNRLLHGERVDHYETVRCRKDGTPLDVSLTVSPLYDAAGQIIGASKISRDITQRKRDQEMLRRRDEELRAMADSIPHLAWMADPEGGIHWFNRRWFDFTGTTLEQMEGWGWRSVHHPETLPGVLDEWNASIREGRPFEMELPLRGADGTYRWFLTRASPVRDAAGKVLRWFGTNTDVDEVRRARQMLKEESRVMEILNNTGKLIASQLDLDKLVQIVTDSGRELIGAKFGAFFYNVIDQQGESFLLYALSGAPREAFEKFGHPQATPLFGPTFKGEEIVRSDDVTKDPRYGQWAPHHGMPKGHLQVRSYLAVPVVSRSGEVIGGLFFGHPETGVFTERAERLMVGIAAQAAIAIDNARLYDSAQREITRRTEVEAALREAQTELRRHAGTLEEQVAERTARLRETIQELEAFSYSVSHDMRSPLRAMQGYAEALLEEHAGDLNETARQYLDRIRRAASRMDLLIQDVLAYSRVAKGEIGLARINLENVIRDVIQNYPALQPHAAAITIQAPLPAVLGHEAYLAQIVSNLLSNAVKFVAPGMRPAVKISARTEGGMASICFEDNGIGIASEHQERIFQIFGRVYSEKQFEGTGIGLAIVKKAAERMGGTARVESEAGRGSRFYIFLRKAE